MNRSYYSNEITRFLDQNDSTILGVLAARNEFALESTQRDAWLHQIAVLRTCLSSLRANGHVYLEYSIPRLGKRIDTILLIGPVLFVIEFKIGESRFLASALDQVSDYALDLKHFHQPSHDAIVIPVLVATDATSLPPVVLSRDGDDGLFLPLVANSVTLQDTIREVLQSLNANPIDAVRWESGRYSPTPTIVEAATALYNGHAVDEISRNEATAINLTTTSEYVSEVIRLARERSEKVICFVTGVPGAGKTLVGLNIATQHVDVKSELHSVFLSGNGPLVAILREALARDRIQRERNRGRKMKKYEALSEVKAFIQNVHHFRDECLQDSERPPIEHVAIFDEAQRAWNHEQTARFMKSKKNRPDFAYSEPEFLISCMDRHPDWAVVVCLVGGGQEINTGEAGISEWLTSVARSFPHWQTHISPALSQSEYTTSDAIESLRDGSTVTCNESLHLAVSMRSFRAELVSDLIKRTLDLDLEAAKEIREQVTQRYPIVITRELSQAKQWMRERARGTERFGIVVSAQALRLKPHAIDVRAAIDPVNWFLGPKEDVRSSYYCEDVATEFHVQGLELDWACVAWDADFRRVPDGWEHWSFKGARWERIKKAERKSFLKNAYRVLLTRARQGMVIVVPEGDPRDPTRKSGFYDATFNYLREIGFEVL